MQFHVRLLLVSFQLFTRMKLYHFLLVILLLEAISAAVEVEWNQFKRDYSKRYGSSEEEEKRFEIFRENCLKFKDHNEKYEIGEFSFKMGVTRDADLTYREIDERNEKNEE